jgi:hypothetical protein
VQNLKRSERLIFHLHGWIHIKRCPLRLTVGSYRVLMVVYSSYSCSFRRELSKYRGEELIL